MKPIIDPRIERRLGRKVLALIAEMRDTKEVERFAVLKRQLARAVADYSKYTKRDTLDPTVDYGYHVR